MDVDTLPVAFFLPGRIDEAAADAAQAGHKGARLAQMMRLQLPVPPGFVLTIDAWRQWQEQQELSPALRAALKDALHDLGAATNRHFGGAPPLLLALRAAAPHPAPELLPSVLNVGLGIEQLPLLAEAAGDAAFAWDCRCRLLRGFGAAVHGIPAYLFDDVEEDMRRREGVDLEAPLSAEQLERLAAQFLALLEEESGTAFPEDPHAQLLAVIAALFASWDGAAARAWRTLQQMERQAGVAVCVQAMVFGNRDAESAAGVASTRDRHTGEKGLVGDYLPRAQGPDLAAGVRMPLPLSEEMRRASGLDVRSMQEALPEPFAELQRAAAQLERHFRRPQHIEFVVQQGRLWLVQSSDAALKPAARVRALVEMAEEGIITRKDALLGVAPEQVEQLLHPVLETRAGGHVLARGLAASPGAASGEVVIDAEEAERLALRGRPVILVRYETAPEDVRGLKAARGVVTARGGMTSHAAVIARGLGMACVSAVAGLKIDDAAGEVHFGHHKVRVGEWITIDGAAGEIYRGRLPTRQPQLSGHLRKLLAWADEVRPIAVRANADTARDARIALAFGAKGIGLCRTEHMFFEADRIAHVRRLILARDEQARQAALQAMLPLQRDDFIELFAIMKDMPVTIRLLDPPAHEFLPRTDAELAQVAELLQEPAEKVRVRVEAMRETNPMLGRRGARLALTLPGLVEMQAQAMFEAMLACAEKGEAPSRLEILVPFVMAAEEMAAMRQRIAHVAERVQQEGGKLPEWRVGCMMELPSACLLAGEIAEHADFFSFGTNDLTQTVLGLSRDDAASFLQDYLRSGWLAHDPFISLHEAVSRFIELAIDRGRARRAGLKVGVCGEHAGDGPSIARLMAAGADHVSCSPFRIPLARLAAAQAELKRQQ